LGKGFFDYREKFLHAERLGQIVIHARLEALLLIARHDMGGNGNDRHMLAGGLFKLPDGGGCLKAVHPRHLYIHQDKINLLALENGHGLLAIAGYLHLVAIHLKHEAEQLLVYRVVFRDKNIHADPLVALPVGARHGACRSWLHGGPGISFLGHRQVKIDNKAASQIDLGQICRVVWLIPAMDRLWIEAAEGRRRFLDRIVLSFDPGHAEATLLYEKAMRERNRLLKEQIRDAGWYRVLETQMAESGHRIHAARTAAVDRLRMAQEAAETAFPAAELELIQSDGGLPDTAADLQEAFEEGRFRDLAAGRTLLGPHRTDLLGTYAAKGVPARDCSTGEQKALLVSLILANARALIAEGGAPPILLLDEVSAHLDVIRRAALYQEIVTLGAQAWMTGTGPELFDEFEGRAQMFTVEDGATGSEVVAG